MAIPKRVAVNVGGICSSDREIMCAYALCNAQHCINACFRTHTARQPKFQNLFSSNLLFFTLVCLTHCSTHSTTFNVRHIRTETRIYIYTCIDIYVASRAASYWHNVSDCYSKCTRIMENSDRSQLHRQHARFAHNIICYCNGTWHSVLNSVNRRILIRMNSLAHLPHHNKYCGNRKNEMMRIIENILCRKLNQIELMQ